MLNNQNCQIGLLTLVAGMLIAGLAVAQSSDPGWIEDLEYELAIKHECEVVEYLDMSEGRLGARNTYYAKIKCADGREFDATKILPQDEFSIRLCENISC